MTLAPNFTCDYESEIPIPTGTNVTIHGNGAVLDAAQQGRFFNVSYGATLALDHLTLQHGSVSGDVSASFIDSSSCSWDDVNGPSVLRNFRLDSATFLLFSNFSVAISTARRSDLQRRDPDCQIRQLHRQFCRRCMYTSSP